MNLVESETGLAHRLPEQVSTMDASLEALLAAAIRAPSGDNTQPWRFIVHSASNRISFHVDATRDPSPMNSGQRMARIAVGAALENLLQTAKSNGWSAELEENPGALACVRLHRVAPDSMQVPNLVKTRMTNRRLYDELPIPTEMQLRLEKHTPILDGVRTLWIFDRDRLARLADVIGRSDALMFGEPSMRRAFLS